MSDPADLTATHALRLMREGQLSAVTLAQAHLDRIARDEPRLKAFVHLDPNGALDAARAADERLNRGDPSPLLGLPLGVKDVLDVAGMPSAYGSPIWAGYRPIADASCVAQARSAGAIVLGKTVTTEFATRKPGPTVNPVNPGHTPGGSSSGSAAGVRAGFFPFAFGTQTAGSVIRPASYCGVVGYMPTHETLHRAGMKVMSESLDTIGVLARTVADCALLIGACSGRDLGDPDAAPARAPRLAVCLGPGADQAQPETLALMERAASALSAVGAHVRILKLPVQVEAAFVAQPVVMNGESAQALAWERANHRAQLSDLILQRIEDPALTPQALDEARATLVAARRAFSDLMADIDAIVTPSAPGVAPSGLDHTGDPAFNALWTALHCACVTVPVAEGPGGLPLGLQIVTPAGRDCDALQWAAWVQHVLTR